MPTRLIFEYLDKCKLSVNTGQYIMFPVARNLTDLDELRIIQFPVGLQPVGCGERDHHQNERHRRAYHGGFARPRLPHHSRASLGCRA